MQQDPASTGSARDPLQRARGRAAVVQLAILLSLLVWLFWRELARIVPVATSDSDWAHALVLPLGVVLLFLCRRREIKDGLTKGSPWGLVCLLVGVGFYALFMWPLDYGYPRQASIVPVAGGIVLATCGWRVFKLCLPMLLLLFLSIPVAPRAYASLIIRPETYTIAATRVALKKLPGVEIEQQGTDLTYTRGEITGAIALGEYARGASLLTTYVAIGVFVVFARIRPFWQVALLALAAGPISLLCNFTRLFLWGLISIYAQPDLVSPMPRAVSATASLVLTYVLFAAGCWILSFFATADSDAPDNDWQDDDETEELTNATAQPAN